MASVRQDSLSRTSVKHEVHSPNSIGNKMERELKTDDSAAHTSPPLRIDEPDPRQSLQHVLSTQGPPEVQLASQDSPKATDADGLTTNKRSLAKWAQEGPREHTEDESSTVNDSYTRGSDINPSYTMTVAHTRRNANGTIGSVYSGNKIRHLKKDDGIPLWRKDIQFAFLRAVFEDPTPAFHSASDGTPGHTFAEIYVDAMVRSSKTSKILKEKLATDQSAAMNMAMICLLVNVGRMNTTLNFFPEMRAQLRTYHAIPCLQAHQDANSYKQLQDAPRLKSILKGASEDSDQPTTLEKIKSSRIPRTNPVNLIFVLSQYAPKISETHFFPPRDFFDLVMRGTLSSRSRGKAFLWLIWWYLESDFSKHAAENNPFGRGQHGENTGGLPVKVPQFDHLTEEQANAENMDTEDEIAYGEAKRLERKRILEEDETVGPPLKKGKKSNNAAADIFDDGASGSPYPTYAMSDGDRTRSPSPSIATLPKPFKEINAPTERMYEVSPSTMRRSKSASNRHGPVDQFDGQRLTLKTRTDNFPASSSPAPSNLAPPPPSFGNGNATRRSKPQTNHQKAVHVNRKMRINHALHKGLTVEHTRGRKIKREESSSFGFMAWRRIRDLPDGYDSEEEGSWGPGGLLPHPDEQDDYGEEALRHKKIIDRALRRLTREENKGLYDGLVQGYQKRKRKARDYLDGQDQNPNLPMKRSRSGMGDDEKVQDRGSHEEALDDLDLDLLGESRDEEMVDDEIEYDSGMDDSLEEYPSEVDKEREGLMQQ